MSQEDSNHSIKNISQIPIQNKYFNNIIKNFDLNNNNDTNSKENIIINNFISNNSTSNNNISNKNYTDNNQQKNSLSSINSSDLKNKETSPNTNPNSFFLLLYKELISLIEETNIHYNYFQNEYNKIKNIINSQNNNSIYESIINIFKKSFIKIITEKTIEITD